MRTLALTTLFAVGAAWACCPAMPAGARVKIADQEVLIVYDAERGVEHFVRSAAFESEAEGFGFLVPTPSQPTLAEADPWVFEALRDVTRPPVEYVKRYVPWPTCLCLAPALMKAGSADPRALTSGVEVLEVTHVAGYDAAVLRADDPAALERWLDERGYDPRPDLREWVQPYVEQGWVVTAFKYVGGDDPRVVAQSVRMSFATDRPLFPYRVPKDQLAAPGEGNLLRLFYVGPERVQGTLGAAAQAWGAALTFARRTDQPLPVRGSPYPLDELLQVALPEGSAVPAGAWLHCFEDSTWPGGTEDLFFTPAAEQTEVLPPPVQVTRTEEIPIPLELIALGAGGVWFVRWRRRRAARSEAGEAQA
ncbi:MAG: DUF2330 domain-containing protein [Planctomycetota bacterium]